MVNLKSTLILSVPLLLLVMPNAYADPLLAPVTIAPLPKAKVDLGTPVTYQWNQSVQHSMIFDSMIRG